jgi:branched-chain amino acid transport system substrate-binding protein
VRGLKDGLGDKVATLIVKELTYETTDSSIDSQIVTLKAAGADTLFLMTTPKFGAQAIRKIAELGWKPLTYLSAVSTSLKTVLEPAGLENSKGLITALAVKRPAALGMLSPAKAHASESHVEMDAKTAAAIPAHAGPRSDAGTDA